jgi:starch phosphorylase
VHEAAAKLGDALRVVYVENYEMALGGLLTSGVDLWLNTPTRPLEASGTSGMKAALNGVPSLSVLDGWWIEGCVEGTTGWAVGGTPRRRATPPRRTWPPPRRPTRPPTRPTCTTSSSAWWPALLRHAVPLGRGDAQRDRRERVVFNTQRMVTQYVHNAYAPGGGATALVSNAAR